MTLSALDSIPWCRGCRQRPWACICDSLPCAVNETALVLLQHRGERRSQSNTGALVARTLAHSRIVPFGLVNAEPLAREELDDSACVVLFPLPAAAVLSPAAFGDVVRGRRTLIVLDGTWRQARRMYTRLDVLRGLPVATLPPATGPRYALRKAKNAHQLSTIEAVASAYRLVGEPAVGAALERVIALVAPPILAARRGPGTSVAPIECRDRHHRKSAD